MAKKLAEKEVDINTKLVEELLSKASLSYSLRKLQKDIVEDTIKKQLKYRGKNG